MDDRNHDNAAGSQEDDKVDNKVLYLEAELQVFMDAVDRLGCDVGMRTRVHKGWEKNEGGRRCYAPFHFS